MKKLVERIRKKPKNSEGRWDRMNPHRFIWPQQAHPELLGRYPRAPAAPTECKGRAVPQRCEVHCSTPLPRLHSLLLACADLHGFSISPSPFNPNAFPSFHFFFFFKQGAHMSLALQQNQGLFFLSLKRQLAFPLQCLCRDF